MQSPMTDVGGVESTTENGVGTITFSHPKSNSLPAAILAELAASVTRFGADSKVKVIVLRSGGTGAFCAGASFSELQGISDEAGGKKFFIGFANLIMAMIRCPKFIIARVQGKRSAAESEFSPRRTIRLPPNSARFD